jgi:hypothetical protein
MTMKTDALRASFLAQMSAPPLPEYAGDSVILRACAMPPGIVSPARPIVVPSYDPDAGSAPSEKSANLLVSSHGKWRL